nr:hypothetical protein [Tanacetum cinerariifolium]
LEALHRHERIREAESETSRTEVALGTGPTVPELAGCTYATFIKCDPLPFIGTEGAVVRLAYQLAGQLIQDKADEATEGEKTKGESDRGGRGDNRREHNRRQNQRR